MCALERFLTEKSVHEKSIVSYRALVSVSLRIKSEVEILWKGGRQCGFERMKIETYAATPGNLSRLDSRFA